MRTSEELGWTQDAYNGFVSEIGDLAFSFVIEAYDVDLSIITQAGVGTPSEVNTLDAAVATDVVIRIWNVTGAIRVGRLLSEDGGDQNWTETQITASGLDTSVAPSIVTNGDTARIFWYDGTSVKYFESTDKGSSWGSAQTVGALSDVEFLAATATTRLHLMTRTGSNNLRLRVYTYSASWGLTSSTIYWPFTPTSFDAIQGNQLDDGAAATNDIIVFSTDFPPLIGYRVDGTELVQYLERVQGMVAIRYQNGRWSDHVDVDVVDNVPDSNVPARTNVRLSKYGEWIFLTYLRKDGSSNYGHQTLAVSRTKTGIHWEMPYLLHSAGTCAKLIKRGAHVYLVDSRGRKQRSPSVGYVGDSRISYDLSDRVLTLDTRAGDIIELQVTLASPEGVLDDILDQDRMWQMRLYQGYYVNDTPVTVQTILADLESISKVRQLPTNHRVLAGRNALGRTTTVRSDLVREWESTQIGGDNFSSIDGTKYSGLRHTAGMAGHWEAHDNVLQLRSGSEPGIGFNLQTLNVWNGSAQCSVKVARTDTDDYAGLIFRGHNKYNFWHVSFDAEQGKLNLCQRKNNTDTSIIGKSVDWTYGNTYYLKVIFRYNYVEIFTSSGGVAWTRVLYTELPGVDAGASWTFTSIPLMRGSMGYVGHGYSEYNPSYSIPPWIPPPIDLPVPPMGWPTYVFCCTKEGGCWFTDSWSGHDETSDPLWENLADEGGAWPVDDKIWAFGVKDTAELTVQWAITTTDRDVIERNGTGWSEILSQATYRAATDATAIADDMWVNNGTLYVLIRVPGAPSGSITGWVAVWNGSSWSYKNISNGRINGCTVDSSTWWIRIDDNVWAISGGWQVGLFDEHYILYSFDSGNTWLKSDDLGFGNAWTAGLEINPQSSATVGLCTKYAGVSYFDITEVVWSTGTATNLESTHLWKFDEGFDLWKFDSEDPDRHIFLDKSAFKTLLTVNNWSSWNDPGTHSPHMHYLNRQVLGEDDDRIIYGRTPTDLDDDADKHTIWAAYGYDDLNPRGKAGPSPHQSPYTNSIPWTSKGVCMHGIYAVVNE